MTKGAKKFISFIMAGMILVNTAMVEDISAKKVTEQAEMEIQEELSGKELGFMQHEMEECCDRYIIKYSTFPPVKQMELLEISSK